MNRSGNDQIELFKRCHFDSTLIILCVRWYLTYKLSYRDLVAIMAERNVDVAHTTILRWVQRYVPAFAKRWQRFARAVGTSWRVDETDIELKGKWGYLYRGVDTEGQTIDFFLREQRDIAAALPAHLVRFERFSGCGHGVLPDAPGAAMALIRAFISDVREPHARERGA